ncbi:MAG TPA: PEP-CTERM sorting domain-containing protein, partial [Lacipirellulaceae bacterium]|nr:PEP-CTERM sorting domain-containing protein [Lacipirellulaceae bacterium]
PEFATWQVQYAPDAVLLSVQGLENADFDGNGVVDGADFLVWQRSLGSSTGADADYDGAVNAADLAIWQAQYAPAGATAASATVPEPAACALLSAALAATASLRRRTPRR